MSEKKIDFKIDDAGVFISLTTMPFGNETNFLDYLKGIFEKYKESIRKTNKNLGFGESDKTFERYFYEPQGYFLWGTFDLALISLVDDFSLGSRDFHPNSNLFTSRVDKSGQAREEENDTEKARFKNMNSFDYQTITTTHSYPTDTQSSKHLPFGFSKLTTLWDKYFCKDSSKGNHLGKNNTDFIGICTFKINNGLILGTGSLIAQHREYLAIGNTLGMALIPINDGLCLRQ